MGCSWRIRDSSIWSWLTSCGKVVSGEVDLLVGGNGPDRICARSIKYCQTGGELRAFVHKSAACCLVLQ